ncbi:MULTISPECIES: phosphoenolpyruvate--protein phosphotransferase [Lysinibacillus]|uniref:Phosphoenolpyruvate-protein phosphotransferase n=1 Tax=Lysinibacillus fusiformis TaxID=28031 RepID=A0A2I0UY03_9BACI|nr:MULTISPECIES: phosphoenolpyruvate--protein phosphotransferase [Lysinibacillus]PKU50948.1 phosphoenolpyruvate--protein phosphotransferase [Lysinibacillus fusiformis]SCY15955.1 phosphoenolpyruvate--protein phosphotransferase [Lysinibacillus sp. SG9]SDB11208.1 phosphoenolpyruvate--protein phosphotransferase [Lysinibacillus sp. TC-37]SFS48383.1 phosphoenolpyruvate--protein phosphotransferase [Lysinibacillus sp. SG55]
MTQLTGIAASDGIAIAKAYRFVQPDLTFTKTTVQDIEAEQQRLAAALAKAEQELVVIQQQTLKKFSAEEAAIFEAHLLVVNDPELIGPINQKIADEAVNAEYALHEVSSMFVALFEGMDNEYMSERASDIKDVTNRILAHLLDVHIPNPSSINEQVIIVANDLTPSETAQLDRNYVLGFITDIGGRTSHSAIMARSLEIPAVVGAGTATTTIQDGDWLIVDGLSGKVLVNPTADVIANYQEKAQHYRTQQAEWSTLVNEQTVSKDGVHVELAANIGSPSDLDGVLRHGAEGIGLYRTEFLYMGRENLPSEEEQFTAYKTVIEGMKGKPVVIRTLDIGGDKHLPYLPLQEEMNPFLGHRAIRLCLEQQELFRTQLRALLRASVYGNLKIMFPMIATIQEFREAKAILLEEKEKLVAAGIAVSSDMEIGMMVEIPATAVMADIFAKEVDFFSIGTNDLIQYTMAADRMNEKVSYLYQPYNPAILRLIQMVIEAAHKEQKWVGMCGEMAGDEFAVPLLLGLGLDEFSMSATSILKTRSLLKQLSATEMQVLAAQALQLATAEEVLEKVKQAVK